ncbi:hypothetical protein [Antarctobacter jejuensis]|uniref:hypothetical protein n=1 Tax=Antarctobacter jejuensis TaxID=1439938 RepID=UPI003FD63565
MAKNSTKADMRPEVIRLARGIDLYRDWRIQLHREAFGTDPDLNEIVMPGSEFIGFFDQTRDARGARSILRDLQSWYSVTAGELRWQLQQGNAEITEVVQGFLERFRTTLGFDLMAEGGLLGELAKQVLKRGHLASDEEWYLLRDLRDDSDQNILSAADMAEVSRIMATFEAAK